MTSRHRNSKRAAILATTAALALAGCSSTDEPVAAPDADVEVPVEAPAEVPFTDENAEELDGAPVDSVDPELQLLSVSPRVALGLDDELDDARGQFVDYCFAGDISEIQQPEGFALLGFDTEQRVAATGAELNDDRRNCVVTSYPAGVDVTSYSLGTVRNSVVVARDGEVNIKDAEAITGRGAGGANELRAGLTTAPELVRVEIDPTLDQARFVFDENNLAAGTAGAQAFGYYTLDGTARAATEVLSLDEDSAVVSFSEAQLEDAVRFFTLPGAVVDRQSVPSNLGAFGARTTAPDLVSVIRESPAQYDFTFDEPVTGETGNQFFLYTGDADRLVGGAVTRPDATTVRVAFDAAGDLDTIVRAAVAPQAVSALDADGITNSIGAESVRGGGTGNQGATSGPDLVDVRLEAGTGRATFVFDETLIDDSPVMERFSLVTEGGQISEAKEIVDVIGGDVTGNAVVVLFDEADAQAAALATVGTGAVLDQQGNRSPVMTAEVSAAGEAATS